MQDPVGVDVQKGMYVACIEKRVTLLKYSAISLQSNTITFLSLLTKSLYENDAEAQPITFFLMEKNIRRKSRCPASMNLNKGPIRTHLLCLGFIWFMAF